MRLALSALAATGAVREDRGMVMRLGTDELVRLAPCLRPYLMNATPTWREIVDAADWLRHDRGVSKSLWSKARIAMGREEAAIALAIVSSKPTEYFRTTPGGYFHGMVAKAKTGDLHLSRTVWALRTGGENKSYPEGLNTKRRAGREHMGRLRNPAAVVAAGPKKWYIISNWRIFIMQTHESPLFTPAEAAVLTRLSLKAVNNAIDKKTVPATAGRRAGQATRLLDLRALMSLALERRLADRMVPGLRRELFEALTDAQRSTVSLEGGLIKVDLREPRRELAAALRELRRARQLVVTDPDILGGDPVFRGTRVPVRAIAAQLESGEAEAGLRQAYPRLTTEMVRLAPLYAAAYPARGRPRTQPWHGAAPVRRIRRKLAAAEAG